MGVSVSCAFYIRSWPDPGQTCVRCLYSTCLPGASLVSSALGVRPAPHHEVFLVDGVKRGRLEKEGEFVSSSECAELDEVTAKRLSWAVVGN